RKLRVLFERVRAGVAGFQCHRAAVVDADADGRERRSPRLHRAVHHHGLGDESAGRGAGRDALRRMVRGADSQGGDTAHRDRARLTYNRAQMRLLAIVALEVLMSATLDAATTLDRRIDAAAKN